MKDIVPDLNDGITTTFQSLMSRDKTIARINHRIRDGTATMVDGHKYAERAGMNLSRAFQTHITTETLPDGKMYFNIANRTVRPALQRNYDLINETAREIQLIEDEAAGIGLDAVMAEFPDGRIEGLINQMVDDEDPLKWLTEPIINTSESFMDDYIKENAKVRQKAGLSATITRIAERGSCKWCSALAGSWEYGDEPPDIYRRHEFCRCAVTYNSGRKAQSVWTKAQWQSSQEELDARIDAKGPPVMSKAERRQALELRRRDAKWEEQILEARKERAKVIEDRLKAGLPPEAGRKTRIPTRKQVQDAFNSRQYRYRQRQKLLDNMR